MSIRYTLDDARRWLRMYNGDGEYEQMTIEQIRLETGVATETIRKWLGKLPEYQPRRGNRPMGIQARHGLTNQGKPGSKAVHRVGTMGSPARKGYRRRGRL
jgi:hypothetical protein